MNDQGTGRHRMAHVPALDGLRGLAVAAVVAYHLGWLSGGFLGVDVFFVLSGYLVTSLLLIEARSSAGPIDLAAFWRRRAKRLVPAVLVVVPVVLAAAVAVSWPAARRSDLAVDAASTLTWWANWRQAFGEVSYWAPAPSPFRHAWSLSIEEQFYLLWPLVVLGMAVRARRRGRSVALTVAGVAAAGVAASTGWMLVLSRRLADADLSRAYVGTDTRLAAPLLGCALAGLIVARRERSDGDASADRAAGSGGSRRGAATAAILGHLGLIAVAAMATTVSVPDPGLYRNGGFLLAAVASASVVAAVVGPGAGRSPGALRSLEAAPLRYLGLRSYALYLWSWPIQVLVQFREPGWSRPQVSAVVVAGSLVAAEVSHRLVEDPLRRDRSWARSPALRRPAWAVGVVAAVCAVLVVQSRDVALPAHERLETEDVVEEAVHTPPPPPLTTTTGPNGELPTGPPPLRVMVEGDSVAFTAGYYAPQGQDLPPGIGSIDGRGAIGCGLMAKDGWLYPAPDGSGFVEPGGGACRRQGDAEAMGLTGDPDVVLLIVGAWEYQAVRSPQGDEVEAQSPQMRDLLLDSIARRARDADAVGAAFAVTAWACPGPETAPERREPDYIAWINDVLSTAVEQASAAGVEATMIWPSAAICVDGAVDGAQTEQWAEAVGREVHVQDVDGGIYLWDSWLGPALVGSR